MIGLIGSRVTKMASEESDDEPLSVLAEEKKLNPEKFVNITVPSSDPDFVYAPKRKKRKSTKKSSQLPYKKLPLTIKFSRKQKNLPAVIQRPADVWLYLKDLNPTGPYSCLLCSEWFINRSKVIVHYVLNHKKDFCGICRYFVSDREMWTAHLKFHTPWPCSQCVENFLTEYELRHHLSSAHKLVHCRLCHFRVPDDDQYNTHLFQKHNVTNVSSKDEEILWELDYDGSPKFLCFLCAKSNNMSSAFFSHFMGFHHFTLKCFTSVISGRDPPFSVYGAEVSAEFVESLKNQKFGYVDLDPKLGLMSGQTNDNITHFTEIKVELGTLSENEDIKRENENVIDKKHDRTLSEFVKAYKGDEDFDVTLMELVVLEKCYSDYINQTLNIINSNKIPDISDVDYDKAVADSVLDIDCSLCRTKYTTVQMFTTHMNKMHSVKSVPVFTCRVCATTFDSQNELDGHISEELGDFEDLWLCQFCDKEFDNRKLSRRHLTEHWDIMEFDNCFSPHLGFKCKYCPTLFWNETDRETHQVRVHFTKYREFYYKCVTESCSELFSDKIWFIHHYLEKHHSEDAKDLYLLKCCICCVVLPTVDDMRSHFSEEHPEARKVFCSLDACQYKPLSHKKSFQLHLRSQHSDDIRRDRAVTCGVCAREFASARACAAHGAHAHGPGKHRCKLCKEALHSVDERKLHYLIRHPGHHPFECNVCGKSFQYKSSLYMHKQEHAPKQSFTCNYCQKVFMKKDSFREHVQIHEGPRHACSYCPMRFVQRSNMLRHERRHTGERPYACPHPQCERTFADKGACNSHKRTHSKESSFACVYCGQTFVQKSKLTYHIRRHTGENLETCSVCSKLFTSPCSLREHMKVHAPKVKESNVKCPLCERMYQDEKYMLRHLRTSHSLTHFACPLCKKTLVNASGLRHHVLTHSPLNVFRCKRCPKSYAVKRTMVKHLRKRHSIKTGEARNSYKKLDPSECQLGLDEQTMRNIFGPVKRNVDDGISGDFESFTKAFKLDVNMTKCKDKDDDDEESDDEEDDDKKESDAEEKKPTVRHSSDDNREQEELEPTDFVSVKIEPLDEEEIDSV